MRHILNPVFLSCSGRLVPIDFGHAFGSATEQLPVPELVPFRLTRQLVGTLAPLDVAGILETPMTHIMKGKVGHYVEEYSFLILSHSLPTRKELASQHDGCVYQRAAP